MDYFFLMYNKRRGRAMKKPNYNHSILNVSATILSHYGVATPYRTLKELKPTLENKKHIMLILLDGMGINILKNLDKDSFFNSHVKTSLTSVYPPTTVAATTSVLSALPPYSHGHIGWVQYNRFEDANTVVFLNKDAEDETHILKEDFKGVHLSYETIMDKIKNANADLNVYQLMPNFVKDGYDTFDQQIDKLIDISKKEASFSYTYWSEPDYSIHENGTNTPVIKNLLTTLEHSVKRLYNHLTSDTVVIIIADHGLIDVKPENLYDKEDLLSLLYRKPSIEPRSTAFFVKAENHKAFKKLFKKYFGNKFLLLSKKAFFKKNLLGYGVKHPLLDDFIGDFMAISTKEYMFKSKPERSFLAHHAGLNKLEMMVPLIILNKKDN